MGPQAFHVTMGRRNRVAQEEVFLCAVAFSFRKFGESEAKMEERATRVIRIENSKEFGGSKCWEIAID